MECTKCGFNNPAESAFCSKCGTALSVECTSCGKNIPAQSTFCGSCGTAVATPNVPQQESANLSTDGDAPSDPDEPKTLESPVSFILGDKNGGSEQPTSETKRADRMQYRVLWTILSLLIPGVGMLVGLYYLRERTKFAILLILISAIPIVGFVATTTTPSDYSAAGITTTATPVPTRTPRPADYYTPQPTQPTKAELNEIMKSKYGINNVIRAKRICDIFKPMFMEAGQGIATDQETREKLRKIYDLADTSVASSLRTPAADMLSGWTQGDMEKWLSAVEKIIPICTEPAWSAY